MTINSNANFGSGYNVNAGAVKAMQLISSSTVSGSAVQTVDIGITLANYEYIVLEFNLLNSNVGSALYSLYFNADTTATNYRETHDQVDGTNPMPAVTNTS